MPMKIVVAHNYYQQPGGEDGVFAAERALLASGGHDVLPYTVHNDAVSELSNVALAKATVWNQESYKKLRTLFQRVGPNVVHVHNTLPLISPSIYYAAKDEGAAVVQTLHNYRLSCVNGLFFRNGHICEDCLGKAAPWPGVARGCYRDSRAASGVVASMLAFHKLRRTYHEAVDVYIALTAFSKGKFVEAGLPAEKVVVKPNFIDPDPGLGGGGGYALFVGRLSQEKGLTTMLAAWERAGSLLPLKIVGDGPMREYVASTASELPHVEWLGRKGRDEVIRLMQNAAMLVLPSMAYENFPVTVVEAFGTGLPVLVSGHGAMAEIVDHGRTGLHFEPGNAEDLAAQVEWVLVHPKELAAMRVEARAEYEAKYTAERNYQMLMDIYERAIALNAR
jgi:glycosyltransferase involved in cell wall biosynthesis